MFRRVTAALVALLAAASLALVAVPAAAAPTTNTNAPAYWQTPGTSETCDSIAPGGKTYTLPAPPAGSVWTKVVVKAGSAPQSVTHENNAYYSDATYYYNSAAPYTLWNQVANLQTTTFVAASDKDISHVIRCWAPAPATPVAGGAASTNESCLRDTLVGGVITVEIKPGVTYTITGPSGAVAFDAVTGQTAPQAPGNYTVGIAATAGYTLTGPASIPLTVAPYGDDCGDVDPEPVAGGAATTNETCVQDALVGGVITVEIRTGVEYTITGPSGAVAFDAVTGMTAPLAPGSYTVGVTATAGYTLTSAASIPLTVAPYGDDCGVQDIPVTPSASVVDETCQNDVLLVGGSITVGPDYGVTYTITGPSGAVAFDALTRTTGELPPGVYTVTPAAKPGFTLTSAAPLIREVLAYGDDCGLITFPGVAPTAVQTQLTCFGDATYTLSDDQPGLAATIWTVNGSPAANGVYPVTADGVYDVHAAPAVGFTFTFGQQTDWEFTFTRPADCDLTTLALTGSDGASGSAWYAALAAGLGLLGAGLIRRAGRAGRAAA